MEQQQAADAARDVVLVVDDTEGNRYTVSRILRGAGFDVREAANGMDALRAAQDCPAIIVLDLNLPDIDGFEVSRRLRARRETAVIPILHLSASYLGNEHRVRGLESGADAYLTHPVDPTVFVATVRALLRMRRIEEELNVAALEWQATFDTIRDAVYVLDVDGRILRANAGAERLAGTHAGELLGRAWAEVIQPLAGGIGEVLLDESRHGDGMVARDVEHDDRWFQVVIGRIPIDAAHRGSIVVAIGEITQRKRTEGERADLLNAAQVARSEAEAANRAKSDFLATMSHEIRTPINAIMGYAQLIEMGLAGPVSPQQRAHLERLHRSAEHLLGLVNEVLDLARVEAGRLEVAADESSLAAPFEAALALARPLALERGITLDAEGRPPDRLTFVGDTARVRQILVNLLSNAVKFTQPGGRIVARGHVATRAPAEADLHGAGPWIAVTVADNGIGIPPDRLTSVFEPFVQAESGPTRAHGGAGLGLTISRRLARLMGGDLTVESQLGDGSQFTLWLPAADGQQSSITEEMPVRAAVPASYDSRLLGAAGLIITRQVEAVGLAFVRRLREEPAIGPARTMSDAQLADHTTSWLADLAQTLVIVAESEADASMLLRDGSAIRNLICERHGMQRHAFGWRHEWLTREYEIMLEEVTRVLRAGLHSPDRVTPAVALLRGVIEQSAAAAQRGFAAAESARQLRSTSP